MKIGVCSAALTWLLLVTSAVASAETPAVVSEVEAKYATVDAMTANFVQTTRSQLYGEEVQKGDVALRRPSKMRWNFTGDGKQFVADGATMWIYSKEDNQVIRYTDYSASSASAQSLLQSLDKIGEMFDIKEEVFADGHHLRLAPRQADGQVKEVQLFLDSELVLTRVLMLDAFDNETELVFDAVTLEAKIPEGTFTFVVPEGVEVIDAGGP